MASRAEIDWAGSYDGYARIAGDAQALWALLEPADRQLRATGAVPAWCGVDLLRAWAFATTRPEWPAAPLGYGWFAVLDAISAHPDARLADLPPGRTD
jgi:hypothetical protein